MPRNNGNAPKRSVAQPATRTDLSYLRIERKYSRFIRAMKFTLIDFGDTASHSRVHRTATKCFTVHRLDHFHHALFPFRFALREQPSLKWRICSWQVAVARRGPWAMPLIIMPHDPQMPSRQSWSNAIGSSPVSINLQLTTSRSRGKTYPD